MASKPVLSTSPLPNAVNETAQNVKENASELASSAKDRVSEAGRQVAETIDRNRGTAADALNTAASTIHAKAGALPGGETVTSVAHSTAGKLETAAGYIREHDLGTMLSDVEKLVKRNPGPALLIAAGIGFLIGRALRED